MGNWGFLALWLDELRVATIFELKSMRCNCVLIFWGRHVSMVPVMIPRHPLLDPSVIELRHPKSGKIDMFKLPNRYLQSRQNSCWKYTYTSTFMKLKVIPCSDPILPSAVIDDDVRPSASVRSPSVWLLRGERCSSIQSDGALSSVYL